MICWLKLIFTSFSWLIKQHGFTLTHSPVKQQTLCSLFDGNYTHSHTKDWLAVVVKFFFTCIGYVKRRVQRLHGKGHSARLRDQGTDEDKIHLWWKGDLRVHIHCTDHILWRWNVQSVFVSCSKYIADGTWEKELVLHSRWPECHRDPSFWQCSPQTYPLGFLVQCGLRTMFSLYAVWTDGKQVWLP